MKKISITILSLALVVGLFFSPGYCDTITLYPEVDTWVYTYNPSASFGSAGELNVGRLSPNYYYYRSFLKFDLSAIPNNSTITSADLSLYAQSVAGTQNYMVYYVQSDSSVVNTMNWNTQPSTTTFLDTKIGAEGWMTWNLLASGSWDYATDLMDTDDLISLGVIRDYEIGLQSQFAQFFSLENTYGDSFDPRLVIEYQFTTVVPLPGAIWLLGSGLLGLGAVGWRRRRKE